MVEVVGADVDPGGLSRDLGQLSASSKQALADPEGPRARRAVKSRPAMSVCEEWTGRLEAALEDQIRAGAPGAVLAISALVPGSATPVLSWIGARGLVARDQPRSLRPEDPLRAASVTKMVTAAVAVRLASQGRWDLDHPIARHLPPELGERVRRLKRLPDPEALTIRSCLGHTGGVPDYFVDPRFEAKVAADPARVWDPAELAEAALVDGELAFAPGTDFAYSDGGYVLVGLALQRLTGQALADVYRTEVFAPLGMDATYLEWFEPSRGGAIAHHYDGDRDLTAMNTSFDWAGGGLVTTATDLVRFLQGLFGDVLFQAPWREQMLSWRNRVRWRPNSSARYLRYGLGLGVNLAWGEELVGATGVWGAFAYGLPARGLAIAGTVNLFKADRAALMDAVVHALP